MGSLNVPRRSMMSFAAIAFFAVGATAFLVDKANDAVNELELLNNGPLATHRIALAQALGNDATTSSTGTLDTSGWKTYRNEKYGFEVKYPASVTPFSKIDIREASENPSKNAKLNIIPPTPMSKKVFFTDKPFLMAMTGEAFIVEISVLDDIVTDFEGWLRNQQHISAENEYRIQRRGREMFNGESAYRVYANAGIDSPGSIILFNHEGKTFFIHYTSGGTEHPFGDIVNSFMFVK